MPLPEITYFVMRRIPHEAVLALFVAFVLLLAYIDAGIPNIFGVLLIGEAPHRSSGNFLCMIRIRFVRRPPHTSGGLPRPQRPTRFPRGQGRLCRRPLPPQRHPPIGPLMESCRICVGPLYRSTSSPSPTGPKLPMPLRREEAPPYPGKRLPKKRLPKRTSNTAVTKDAKHGQ